MSFGRDAGGDRGGAQVIKKFDYAYYVTRSGAAARAVVTPTARVGDAAALQDYIDHQLPAGTTHCLQITDRGDGLFAVTLAETRPGQQPTLLYQLVRTVDLGGRTFITAIDTDPAKGK
ncbi:hypothetical protein [Jatrophihabitans endophyticus]|uniref:hypothetical protein n=1 Tax=Jatrophihabitans endophyticus TaxID=1206085 RepID=UPI001A031E32|nr:hypothetical protein [Jatrophihabitans endophyticus]MBE7190355.1 hypothetical protein [Jatrophihabitans endophyticus]